MANPGVIPLQQNEGYQTSQLPKTTQDYISQLAQHNPEAVKDPYVMAALGNQTGQSQQQLANLIGYQQMMHTQNHSQSLGGYLYNAYNGISDSLSNFFGKTVDVGKNVFHYFSDPNYGLQQDAKLGRGALDSVSSIGQSITDTFNRLRTQGLRPITAGGIASSAGQIVTAPIATANLFLSDVNRNGVAYAVGSQLPYLLAAGAGGAAVKAGAGAEMTAGEAQQAVFEAQLNADREIVRSSASGMQMSPAQAAEVAPAMARLEAADPQFQWQLAKDTFSNSADPIEQGIYQQAKSKVDNWQFLNDNISYANTFTKSAEISRAIGSAIGKPARIAFDAAVGVNRALSSTEANLLYAQNMIATDPKLWAQAQQGVVDSKGRLISTGAAILEQFGMKQGDFGFSTLANLINIDMNLVVDDPLTRVGKFYAQSKSFAGFTGAWRDLAPGLGLRTAGDATRAYEAYSSVRRAVGYIATHNAGDIMRTFRNTFGPKLAQELGKASTPQEVLSVLENVQHGLELVGGRMPTLGWYSVFKTALRGELGDRIGILGKVLGRDVEVTEEMVVRIKEQTGLDLTPDDAFYLRQDMAGKARVLWRKKLADQFTKTPMWLNERTGKWTNYEINAGSYNAIPAIQDWAMSLGMPKETVDTWANELLFSIGDPKAYKSSYRSLVFEAVMRPTYAVSAHTGYESVLRQYEKYVWDEVDRMTGQDGAGLEGMYGASKENIDKLATDSGNRQAALLDNQRGTLILPNRRQILQYQRRVAEVILSLKSTEAEKLLLSTDSTLAELKSLANFSKETTDRLIAHLGQVYANRMRLGESVWQVATQWEGYQAKAEEILSASKKMSFDGATSRAERVATFVKYLESEARNVRTQAQTVYHQLARQSGLGSLSASNDLTVEDILRGRAAGVADEQMKAYDHLLGEQRAIDEFLAETKAKFSKPFDNGMNVEQLAESLGKMTIANKTAREKFIGTIKDKWNTLDNQPVLWNLGKRGMRNNREVVSDVLQAYLNKFFKPLALTSPGWALRVSASEGMLNALRIGGWHSFEARMNAAIAKHEFRLGGIMEAGEKQIFKNAMHGFFLGFEESLIKRMPEAQRDRFLSDMVDLFVEHDGHLPNGVHAHHDVASNDNTQDAVYSREWGLDSKGRIKQDTFKRGDTFTKIYATDNHAGTAFHEALSMRSNDRIARPGWEFLHQEATLIGQQAIIDDPTILDEVMQEARANLSEGVGAEMFARREQMLDFEMHGLEAMTQFRVANDVERTQVIDQIMGNRLTPDQVLESAVPKSYRNSYTYANNTVARVESQIPQIESRIREQQAKLDELMKLYASAPGVEMDKINEVNQAIADYETELRQVRKQRANLDELIKQHPFNDYYRYYERGASVRPYQQALTDLRGELRTTVTVMRDEAEKQLRELTGGERLVLPRHYDADMSLARMMIFKDAEGNPLPNSEMYANLLDRHADLWTENDRYKSWLPFGMPNVDGRDFLGFVKEYASTSEMSMVQWVEKFKTLVNHSQLLDEAVAHMESGKFEAAFKKMMQVDPANVKDVAPLLPSPETVAGNLTATKMFSVRGVPPEIVLGVGRTKERTVSDLAQHMRDTNALDVSYIADQRFYPNYTPDEIGREKFIRQFEEFQKILKSKTITDFEQIRPAAKWFAHYVGYNEESWALTARQAWDRNMSAYRQKIARDLDRDEYYKLLDARKQLSAEASKIGVRKARALEVWHLPTGTIAQNEIEMIQKQIERESKAMTKLQDTRSALDDRLIKANSRRDQIAEHVVKQDAKARARLTKEAESRYATRLRANTKGIGGMIRRIEARTGTINGQIERQAEKVMTDAMVKRAREVMSNPEYQKDLRGRLEEHFLANLMSMSPQDLAEFERSTSVLANPNLTTGDPMMDWAKALAEDTMTLSFGDEGTAYPEVMREVATGDLRGPRAYTKWFSENKGKDLPTNIPARSFVSPLAKGSRSNLITQVSDKMHSAVLGPIVNDLVREPLFGYEYHVEMERLRPYVNAELLTEDQAKVLAKTNSTIGMSKFIHQPLDKTQWEHNMRILTPFYFAKNQAMRRAFRLAGDNIGAFEKYMKWNLAISNYVAPSTTGNNQFHIPGSEAISGIASGMSGTILSLFGNSSQNGNVGFGFDGSPSSIMSIVVTGQDPTFSGILGEAAALPFGPVVTVPVKMVSSYLSTRTPVVSRVLQNILGSANAKTSWLDDLVPNPLIRNTYNGTMGFINQNNASSYASIEGHVYKALQTQEYDKFYRQVEKMFPQTTAKQLAQFGSREQMLSFYATALYSQWAQNPKNMQDLLDRANAQTAVLYGLKTVMSFSLPISLTLNQQSKDDVKLQEIKAEKNADGSPKFPTYFLQVEEFMRRNPLDPFAFMSATKTSNGSSSWGETNPVYDWLTSHQRTVESYPLAASYLAPQAGADPYYSPAFQLELSLGLRARQAPNDFHNAYLDQVGNQFLSDLYTQAKMDPAAIELKTDADRAYYEKLLAAKTPAERLALAQSQEGHDVNLNPTAAKEIKTQATMYGQSMNVVWLKNSNTAVKDALAGKAYNSMKSMLADPGAQGIFTADQKKVYQFLISQRAGYAKQYESNTANGISNKALENEWYDWCTTVARQDQMAQYQSFITGVLRKLPPSQG